MTKLTNINSRAGYTFAPMLVVVFVATAAVAVLLFIVFVVFNPDRSKLEEDQAYFSALSITQGVTDWIVQNGVDESKNESRTDEQYKVDELLTKTKKEGQVRNTMLQNAELPEEMGSCIITITYTPQVISTINAISNTETMVNASKEQIEKKDSSLIECYTVSAISTLKETSRAIAYRVFKEDNKWRKEYYYGK